MVFSHANAMSVSGALKLGTRSMECVEFDGFFAHETRNAHHLMSAQCKQRCLPRNAIACHTTGPNASLPFAAKNPRVDLRLGHDANRPDCIRSDCLSMFAQLAARLRRSYAMAAIRWKHALNNMNGIVTTTTTAFQWQGIRQICQFGRCRFLNKKRK